MTLIFYNFEFELLCAQPRVISSTWTVYYNGVGRFEAHLPLENEAVETVVNNRYLVARQGKFCAIVTGYELRDELIVYGRTCNWLLSKRITPAVEATQKSPALLAEGFVKTAFSDVENLEVEAACEADAITFEFGEATTLEVVTACLDRAKAGHSLLFDFKNKKWVFSTFSGRETGLIISEANKNAYDTCASSDILDYATCGIFDLAGDNGTVSTDIIKESDKTGIYRWQVKLSETGENEAVAALEGKKVRCEATTKTHGIKLGEDYELGDIVRVQIIKGAYRTTVKRRITGVEVRFGYDKCSEQPIFEEV